MTPPARPPRLVFLLPCALLLAAAAGCHRSADGAAAEAEAEVVAPVKVATATEATFAEWTDLLGTTQPLPGHAARVSAGVEGKVLWVLKDVREGQHVEKGQVLVQLDDRVARANRDKVEAGQAELKEAQKQSDNAVELARIDLTKLESLLTKGQSDTGLPLVARVDIDKARLALKDAESKQKGAAARLEAARAEVRALDEQLTMYTLKAPIAGRLGQVQVQPGQALAVGTVAADVTDLDEIDVLCFVPPHAAAQLAAGQPARRADEPEPAGTLAYLAVQAQAETGNFPAKVRLPNGDLRLRAGSVAHVQVQTQPAKARLVVPEAALLQDQEPPVVVVVQEEKSKDKEGGEATKKVARRLTAKVGVRDREKHLVEILGLEDADKKPVEPKGADYVVEGAHGLHDGDVVKVEEEHGEEPKDEK